MTTTKTRGQQIAADVSALLRARNPLIWIVTGEEARVEGYLHQAAASASYQAYTWDVGQGCIDIDGNSIAPSTEDPGAALDLIGTYAKAEKGSGSRRVWIMRDLPVWLAGPPMASTLRKLRNLARLLPTSELEASQAIVVLSPSGDVPPELAGHATVIEWPLPDRAEIAEILDMTLEGLDDDVRKQAAPNGTRDAAIDAAVGLSGEEAQACYASSLVKFRKIDPAAVAKEKKRIIAREGLLEWVEPLAGGMDEVGGLDNLKTWLKGRSSAYSPAARAYGLPAPKGIFVAGISGCGKSMTAKAIACNWTVPLLRFDMNALKSKFVGESEANIRKAFKVIEAIGRCVVWIDEIEKALQGATSGSSDGGTSADALGTFLSWMQDRSGEAFVIATANDIQGLPPEILRKGRFDELWWIDLPTPAERQAILASALRSHGRKDVTIEWAKVSASCDGFTGSEIAALVPDALFAAFADGAREITTDDLIWAAASIVPLSVTAKAKIDSLREMAKNKMRPATATVAAAKTTARNVRALDLA